jgi:hypothetical protein
MFWKPDQTGQSKQKARSLARRRHPQTATRKPTDSNRKPKLLETPHLQQNKPGSGLSIVSAIAEQSTQPGDINGRALIAKKPMFSPSILTHLPQPARTQQGGQPALANRPRIPQTRTKREAAPLIYVSIKRRPDPLFSSIYERF